MWKLKRSNESLIDMEKSGLSKGNICFSGKLASSIEVLRTIKHTERKLCEKNVTEKRE